MSRNTVKIVSPLLTRQECADYLRMSVRRLDELTKQGTLTSMKCGSRVTYHRDVVESEFREKFSIQAKS